MSFYEMICFAKVYNAAFGIPSPSPVTKQDVEITIEILKKMADSRNDWPQQEKESYKLLADFAKEYFKNC